MEVFLYNIEYMMLNFLLALIAVVFGYLMIRAKNTSLRLFYGFIWLIFLPNTAYILLDLVHLYEQWSRVDFLFKILLIIQYGIFSLAGVFTFIIATNFFEKLFWGINRSKSKKKEKTRKIEISSALLILNFLVGFGAIMGFVLRTNSWHILTQPLRVFEDTQTLLFSPNLFIASLIFGLIANIIYFYFGKPVVSWGKRLR